MTVITGNKALMLEGQALYAAGTLNKDLFFCFVPLLYGCDHFLFTKQLGSILWTEIIRHTQCPIFSFFFLERRGSFRISDFCCLNGSITHDVQDGEL